MEAVYSSRPTNFYQTPQCYIPEYSILQLASNSLLLRIKGSSPVFFFIYLTMFFNCTGYVALNSTVIHETMNWKGYVRKWS
jgi:hypothetical protein